MSTNSPRPVQHTANHPTGTHPITQRFAQKHGWNLDLTNTEERHVPGNFAGQFKVHNQLGNLGAHYIKNYGNKTDGWCAT